MTKLQLLEKVSQEDIIKTYLQSFNPTSKKNYHSPFGKDDKPSLAFYQSGSNWKFKSHNTGHAGDVFQFVADLKGIDCKKNFKEVIDQIAEDMQLKSGSVKQTSKPVIANAVSETINKKKNLQITFEKGYTKTFLNYFDQFKINVETLIRFEVFQVKQHDFISSEGKRCKFDYSKSNQVAVCYQVNGRIKIYFPKLEGIQEKKFGFKEQTNADIFGLTAITKQAAHHSILFITAGEKDCLSLNSNGFPAICFQSENTSPSPEQIKSINSLSDKICIVYDNDAPGRSASDTLAKTTGWNQIQLPANFKDVAEFFIPNSTADFRKIVEPEQTKPIVTEPNTEENNFTIFHAAENYLKKNYIIRFNTIKLELESKRSEGNEPWGTLNENDLFCEMNKRGVKIGMDKLIAILKSNFITRYNPIREYFNNLPAWDKKTDHIASLVKHLESTEPDELLRQFTKWLVRSVRSVMLDGSYNKQAFILIQPKQNSGKTTFCRFLCPAVLQEYISENISDDKDSKIALAKNFLINLDELSSLAKHEINSLKSLFSKDVINERLPYDRRNSIIHRIANFIGSTNMAEFLTDETGSVRWLCFEIKKIDWSYSKTVNIDNVWSQALSLLKTQFECDMNRADIDENEVRNSKFQQLTTEAEMIPNFLKPSVEGKGEFMTATDILFYLTSFTTIKLNRIMIGKAMPVLGFTRVKESLSGRYGYFCTRMK
jgi:DNA primase